MVRRTEKAYARYILYIPNISGTYVKHVHTVCMHGYGRKAIIFLFFKKIG